MTSTTDQRQAAATKIHQLIGVLKAHAAGVGSAATIVTGSAPATRTADLIEESEALVRAVGAFHLEGIRFRMFNVDRLARAQGVTVPAEALALLDEIHRHLEAAGFHTRSHQAPG